jgi:nicotinamide/nicotinate riboside kinase
MDAWLVIGISGVTCSGKTTLAKALIQYFQDPQACLIKENKRINKVCLIQQDDYFVPKDDAQPWTLDSNRENMSIVNTARMSKDILEVLGVNFLLYNCDDRMDEDENLFAKHRMLFSLNQKLNPTAFININILILEGFLIFNHPFTLDLCNLMFHMHVPYELCYKRRKERHRVRLGSPDPDGVGYFEKIVWPMYVKHFNAFKDHEGVVILNGILPKEQILKFVVKSIECALED